MAIIHTATIHYRHGHKPITMAIPQIFERFARPLAYSACHHGADYIEIKCTEDLGDHSLKLRLKVTTQSDKFDVYFDIFVRGDKLHVVGKTKDAKHPELKRWINAVIVKGALLENELRMLLD